MLILISTIWNKFICMCIIVNSLTDNLVNHIYHYSIGDTYFWMSKFTYVINDITYFNADDIGSDYFSNKHVRHNDPDIDIINCWYYLEYNKFKQYMIKAMLHILKSNNHPF